MTDLNILIPPSVTLSDARAINDAGQILANGQDNTTHQSHAYLLTPDDTVAPGSSGAVAGLLSVAGVPSHSFAAEELGTPSQKRETPPMVADGGRVDVPAGSIQDDIRVFAAQATEEQPVEGLTDPLAD
jgi:hypothetical protein